MNRYEWHPGDLDTGADCLHDGTRPYVNRTEHNAIVQRLEAELAAERREVERMTWAICHLLMRDGTEKHGGRVSNRLLARAVSDGAA